MKERELRVPGRRRRPVGAVMGAAGVVREGPPPARLTDEKENDYKYFEAYWRCGAARSLRDMAARLGVCYTTLSRARKRHQWDARIQAALEEPAEVKQGWVARREMLREAEWKLHEECLEAGREALRKWRAAGKAASLGEVVKLLEFGARLARLAAGMPDNHTMITGEDGEPIRIQFEAALAQAYGPVVDVVSEVVEGEPERMANGKRDRETGEVRSQVTAVEGGAGGGAEVRGTDRGAVRCVEAAGSVDGENHSGQAHEGAPA